MPPSLNELRGALGIDAMKEHLDHMDYLVDKHDDRLDEVEDEIPNKKTLSNEVLILYALVFLLFFLSFSSS